MKITKRTVEKTFRDFHRIRIPAGTPVKWIEGGRGGYAVSNPSQVELIDRTESIFKHDSTYYYIWVDESDVTNTTKGAEDNDT